MRYPYILRSLYILYIYIFYACEISHMAVNRCFTGVNRTWTADVAIGIFHMNPEKFSERKNILLVIENISGWWF